ncbi:hypothetical protein [Yinghuangia soli]|uniref:Cellulose synthase n=1 Tax=Yinghuangia soli TaxID=2908204 RepID=A0AA41TZN4_9ACTN|nr:hypothetical protein [Yinghuangia soli]MCF2529003.1 hypothetical protein [Yinghuangia soli]
MSGAGVVTGAVCAALTGLGLVLAVRAVQQDSYLRATRWVGLALIPTGLFLTGLATLGRRVVDATADWATDLVFGMRAWAGVAVLVVAFSLLLLVRTLGSRRSGDAGSGAAADPAGLSGASGRSLTGAAPAAGAAAPKPAKQPRARRGSSSGAGDEFAEIEEILRRRGI